VRSQILLLANICDRNKDAKGIDHIKLAMNCDRELVPVGKQILSSFLQRQEQQGKH
jgi:hypothetical protein